MAELYVSNPLLQHYEFNYRIPGKETPRTLRIGAGRQEKFPEQLEGLALADVIRQLERYGAVPESELTLITKPNALVYRVAKPIQSDAIDEARALDQEARQELAGAKMEESGLKAFGAAQATLQQNGMGSAAEALQETSVEIIEVTDVKTVRDGVNYEATVSKKPGKAGRIRHTQKR